MRTLGQRVYRSSRRRASRRRPSAAGVLPRRPRLGLSVSTTHVISGGIFGAGSARRPRSVRWGVAGDIGIAAALTVPASAAIAALAAALT